VARGIRGNYRQSEVIRGHQRHSKALEAWSEALRGPLSSAHHSAQHAPAPAP
jgi:hypothetical protein